jgi:copper oxidase (laccase) domain-containing protein
VTEAFPFLNSINAIPGIRAAWVERVPELDVTCDRDEAMRRLRPFHETALMNFAGPHARWWRAEQIHGNSVAIIPDSPEIIAPDGLPVVPHVDGLLTREPGHALAIYVADCGAIWLADQKSGAIGLLHSGKNGTAANIFGNALTQMAHHFGTCPLDVTAVLSPCIRPPDYEVDFAAQIARQARQAGVGNFIDYGFNTASDPSRFYSYRKQLGKTGRLMALIARDFPP